MNLLRGNRAIIAVALLSFVSLLAAPGRPQAAAPKTLGDLTGTWTATGVYADIDHPTDNLDQWLGQTLTIEAARIRFTFPSADSGLFKGKQDCTNAKSKAQPYQDWYAENQNILQKSGFPEQVIEDENAVVFDTGCQQTPFSDLVVSGDLILGDLGGAYVLYRRPGTAPRASFDCAKARSPDEKLICSHELVSLQDRMMAKQFAAWRGKVPESQRAAVSQSQRAWVAERNKKCGIASKTEYSALPAKQRFELGVCFERQYDERLAFIDKQGQSKK